MKTSSIIIDIIITLIVLYLFYFREFILGRKEFKCLRCGNCCRLRINLTKQDIERIEKAGYKDFLGKNNKLKKINGHCKFLMLKDGITTCSIDNIKPEVCKRFPIGKGIFGKKVDMRCKTCSWKLC